MRLFVAIRMPEETAAAIARLQDEVPIGRPVPKENLHLTLAFVDERRPEEAEAAHEALEGLRAAPVEIAFGGMTVLDPARPQAVVLPVPETPALEVLHRAVMSAVRRAGIDLPRRRFRPHVTLVRLAGRPTPDEEARLARVLGRTSQSPVWPFTAREVVLFRSHLRREGAVYEELAAYPLG